MSKTDTVFMRLPWYGKKKNSMALNQLKGESSLQKKEAAKHQLTAF